jgi:tRNA-dihydrouridine synthase C
MNDFWIKPGKPALFLAPMEGVTDGPMRLLFSELPGFTHLVTEFLRISQEPLPQRLYSKHAQELLSGSRTPSGKPVIFQLLGGNPEKMAESARRAVLAGAKAIDINFGCPAPTVNRNDGGATLLRYPERIEAIVSSMRKSVPEHIPVSVKMRLGWDNPNDLLENAKRAVNGGASWIAVHGRTKFQGYTPPAYWKPIGELRRAISIPVIANGEIWNMEDFYRCREETGCEHFMLGRGALANPFLAQQIIHCLEGLSPRGDTFPSEAQWQNLMDRFFEYCKQASDHPHYGLRRAKQWAGYVNRIFPIRVISELRRANSELEFRNTWHTAPLFLPASTPAGN